jgi:hypothetical protein
VTRDAGQLVPGFTKRFDGAGGGMTSLWGMPIGRFVVRELEAPAGVTAAVELDYVRWPVRDHLALRTDGSWYGRGLVFGRQFCRFLLTPSRSGLRP